MLTLLASLVRWSTVAVLLVGLGFVASSLVTGQGADFVDLTGRPVIEPADVGRLASQMAQIRNASPAAPEYRQPLPVTLEIVAMSAVDRSAEVVVDVRLENRSSEPLFIPIGRDPLSFYEGSGTEQYREAFRWNLNLRSSASGREVQARGTDSYRRTTDPEQTVTLDPDESLVVRFQVTLTTVWRDVTGAWQEGLRRGEVTAAVELNRAVFQNTRTPQNPYFFRHESEPVLSGFVPISIEP